MFHQGIALPSVFGLPTVSAEQPKTVSGLLPVSVNVTNYLRGLTLLPGGLTADLSSPTRLMQLAIVLGKLKFLAMSCVPKRGAHGYNLLRFKSLGIPWPCELLLSGGVSGGPVFPLRYLTWAR